MSENSTKKQDGLLGDAIHEALQAVDRKKRELGDGHYCHSYIREYFTGFLLGYVSSRLHTIIDFLSEPELDNDIIKRVTAMNSEDFDRLAYFFDFPDLDDLEKQDDH